MIYVFLGRTSSKPRFGYLHYPLYPNKKIIIIIAKLSLFNTYSKRKMLVSLIKKIKNIKTAFFSNNYCKSKFNTAFSMFTSQK